MAEGGRSALTRAYTAESVALIADLPETARITPRFERLQGDAPRRRPSRRKAYSPCFRSVWYASNESGAAST